MAKLVVTSNVLGALGTNCFTIVNQDTREAVVIDPADRADYLVNMYKTQNFKPVAIFLTHGHIDHIGAVNELKEALGDIPVYAAEEEADVLKRPELNLSTMLFGDSYSVEADELLKDEQEIELLGTKIKCILVPGHTKGGMCYYFEEEGMLFCGDTIFHYSIGRDDFPTGDGVTLRKNIREKLLTLPEDVELFPGHMERSTIKKEKMGNPYFAY